MPELPFLLLVSPTTTTSSDLPLSTSSMASVVGTWANHGKVTGGAQCYLVRSLLGGLLIFGWILGSSRVDSWFVWVDSWFV